MLISRFATFSLVKSERHVEEIFHSLIDRSRCPNQESNCHLDPSQGISASFRIRSRTIAPLARTKEHQRRLSKFDLIIG